MQQNTGIEKGFFRAFGVSDNADSRTNVLDEEAGRYATQQRSPRLVSASFLLYGL